MEEGENPNWMLVTGRWLLHWYPRDRVDINNSYGAALHLWSEKTFKAIVWCWLETSLKNHLKWERLNIRGGHRVPSVVIIEDKGLIYIIPISSEIPMRVDVGEEWKNLWDLRNYRETGSQTREEGLVLDLLNREETGPSAGDRVFSAEMGFDQKPIWSDKDFGPKSFISSRLVEEQDMYPLTTLLLLNRCQQTLYHKPKSSPTCRGEIEGI